VTTWQELRDEAAGCTRCGLYQGATQTVFGEGWTRAAIALVGDQPGDQEDKHYHPCVRHAVGTIHPSAVLREPDQESRDRASAGLASDLVAAREAGAGTAAR
jgi:uracil-DNA glycosylase